MAVSMRDLDPAFTGAGQKAYPLSHEIFSIFTIVDILRFGLFSFLMNAVCNLLEKQNIKTATFTRVLLLISLLLLLLFF